MCFLLSHANAFPSDFGQVALLRSVAAVADKGKIQILLPTIKSLVEKAASTSAADLLLTIPEELAMRLLLRMVSKRPVLWIMILSHGRSF
jgi:hypothetical protein